MARKPVRIATRGSRLALWQANHVAQLLRQRDPDLRVDIVTVAARGDVDRSQPLERLGGEGVFTREIQNAVIESQADVAVHSLKDLPTEPTAGLTLAAVPKRGSMFDALVLPASSGTTLRGKQSELMASLPHGARIGTGSPRRRAQLFHHRNDFCVLNVRGNVETRIAKLDSGEYEALVLAEAGLQRLGIEDRITVVLEPPLMYSAVGQGALGIECRSDDEELRLLLAELSDRGTRQCVLAERRLLAALRAGCHAPLGVMTRIDSAGLTLEAVVLSNDGRQRISAAATGRVEQPERLGDRVAAEIVRQGGDRLITEMP
ncbi:MAG: hydroxymethylbilane synthase [Planctomycetaceae bacterium]